MASVSLRRLPYLKNYPNKFCCVQYIHSESRWLSAVSHTRLAIYYGEKQSISSGKYFERAGNARRSLTGRELFATNP